MTTQTQSDAEAGGAVPSETETRLAQEIERLRAALLQAREANHLLRRELAQIQTSRLWRVANLYWSLRRRLGLIGAARSESGESGGASPAAQATRSAAPSPAREPGGGEATAAAPLAAPPEIAPLAAPNRYDVLCLPIIDWDFRFQRPQQLASRFAAAGHRVFYLAQNFRAEGPPFLLTEKRTQVWEVSLRGRPHNVYREAPGAEAVEQLFAAVDALRREAGLGATAMLVELPFWWPLAERLRARYGWPIVYDCMDLHAGFSTNDLEMLELEEHLLAGADRVVVSAKPLEALARAKNERVLLLPNACDYEHFSAVRERPPATPPVVGYYGAISDWFDVALVEELARARPQWRFLLVGDTAGADVERLARLPNVELTGEVRYAELPRYVERMDVCTIPFRRTPLTEATNPVKAYEILAAGKPLVAVPLPELAALGDLVATAEDAAGFARAIERALAEHDAVLVERRRAFARGETWEARFARLAPEVAAAFPRLSLAIVAFRNREWTATCLASLREQNEWPNLEPIVVDNASGDGTAEWLRGEQERWPALRVVLNPENEGFARATNQALARASGDYLVLLNNDTAVPRGALAALVRHLASAPGLGLLGPSTNEIGNEAKVEVGYRELAEMPDWARRFVRLHDGEREPIAMLAMFCLAARRATFERLGPLDEQFEVGMFEDDDYTRRAREAGLEVAVARDAFVHHAGRAAFAALPEARYREIFDRNRARFERKWGPWRPHAASGAAARLRDELSAYRLAHGGERTVIFLPSIGWHVPLVQRPHHLAREFARRGWLAVFDTTGSAAGSASGLREVAPRLLLFDGPLEGLLGVEEPLLWALPYNAALVERWPRRRVVYDWIDDFAVFDYSRREIEFNHVQMLATADLVACVSRPLVERARASRPDALYLPNAADFEHFGRAVEEAPAAPEYRAFVARGRPIAGYYGALAPWFDAALVTALAARLPEWGFVIIGQALAGAPSLASLARRDNVLVLPPVGYEELPTYLAHFTVAVIPFRQDAVTEATSPLKLYEYLAAGKPVVASPMPECAALAEVETALGVEQWVQALERARASAADPAARARRRERGRAESWRARVDRVEEALAALPPISARSASG